MLKIIPLVLQIVGVCSGIFIGLSLKNAASSPKASETSAHADQIQAAATKDKSIEKGRDKHSGNDGSKKTKSGAKKDSHTKSTGAHGDADKTEYGFIKFSRQFIVPVIGNNGVNSLVVLDINLEVPPSTTEKAYSREPKLRDALLRSLLLSSNEGLFDDQLLENGNIDAIRERLLEAARTILENDVNEVLILSIARQDL